MRHEEYGKVPARWLMVPAGVEIDLEPPCGAARPVRPTRFRPGEEREQHVHVCGRCGAHQPEKAA
ncbi:hypothetical protein [Streptomyces sp. NPDC001137]|uniref:hypothetical protein n=1 Tax=Streptomyces sp. NPDC001137 TaxID=3154378 RepID=UPI00331A4E6F